MALPLLLLAALLARSRSAQIPGAGSADEQDSGYDIVHPVKVDERGVFLSYNLSHRWLHRRAISSKNHPLSFYKLYHGGQELRFNLSLNRHLLAPGFVSERRFGGIAHAEIQAHNQNSCHMVGSVQNQEQENGFAALSTCDGLKGVFRLADEDFFIEPLSASKFREKTAHPHRIYRRHVPEYEAEEFISVVSTKQDRKQPAIVRMCGVQGSLENSEKQREKWEGMRRRKRRIKQRSVSKEKWVETLVVADTKMVEYHGSRDVERYVLTVMNMVAGLFHDASIGNPIHVSIVRLIFLEEEEEDLKITHHADNTLKSFCKWQKSVNVKGDAHPLHHDVAILLTRKDLCAAMNRPCETLGLSHVSGMCQPHRSCNINEDTGLPLAFTVAHELGHSGVSTESASTWVTAQSPSVECGQPGAPGAPVPELAVLACRMQSGSATARRQSTAENTAWGNESASGFATQSHAPRTGPLIATSSAAASIPSPTRGHFTNGPQSLTTNVGCDYEIDSYAVEDRCGVCHGDGSTCETVKRTFEESDGLGYVDVGLIPAGAREIQIEEVAEAENFLALRSENPDKYFLNGGWTIQWNGDYKVAGTTFTYERTGNWENLTSPGPTEEPVWIQLLFQEKNPGIRYQYTIQRESDSENEIAPAEFFWQYGPWTKCTATCGTGVQRQIVHCVEKVAGIVEERYCNVLSRPDDQQRSCSEEPCPARWWAGEWQVCSATCGDTGLMKRTILCIQSVALDEQRALLPGKCQHLLKPDAMAPCNREVLCPAQWAIGNWSECSVTCGSGTQQRPVYCPNDTRASCAPGQKPASEIVCSLPLCWNRVESIVSDWSGSGSSSQELFNEINFIPHHHIPRFSPSTPESKDLNAIMEDFSPSNNKKGNVFVDDFYYDYNFINFHEDLSYDPVDEKGSMGEDLKPDLGRKMVTSMKGDSNEMLPDFLPIVKPESRMDKKSTKSPDIGGNNEEETDGVHKHTTVANLHSPVGTTMVPWATSPTAVSGKGTPPPLWGDHPSTSAAARHFPDASENTVLRGNVAAATTPASFSYWTVPTPMSPPGKGSSNQGSEPGAPEGRMQEAESSQVPYHSASEPNRWLGVVQKGDGEERGAGRAVIDLEDDRGAARRTKEAPVGTVSATAAATARGPPDHFIHQRSRSTETTPNLPTQDTSENSKDPGDVMDSHNMANGKSHAADAQNHRHYPVVEGEDALPPTIDLPPVAPTLTLAYTFSGHGSQALASHNPNSSGLQLPTEPTFGGQSPAAPNSFPSVSPAPSQKESMGINLGAKDTPSSGDKGLFRNQSSSNGVHWMFASGSGGLQPSLAPVKHQEEGKDGTPSVVPSAAVVAAPNASWEAGNWSECSTTCGLGAIWRTVRCSTGQEEDCSPARKPIPARRCYLRPCSTWRVGNWSKCSRTCGGGVKVRDIHCVDTRDQRPLRPFHCQATPYKPPTQMPCQSQPCLGWYTSAWRECSELCGGGEQQRLVTCPEFGRCDEALRPNNTRPCNVHPCTKWTVGSWGQCTATCGGGIQRRQVKCVNTKTGEAEEDNSLCDHEQWPENTQKCNPQDCSHSQPSVACERDRLSFSFCQTLLVLSRCHLPTVSLQCCQTCQQHGHGEERASRK
ncbi:A disintegrin and metalloproteinase with thrombospondin motifs 7 isoform X3 [Rhineura floridana]|uniref:A disintegrin and metalloproteinase with thrombospondin motifs 7 isoform X3 n=1 Tax=Rhineura floridana TaxID=261503 RepID=UPI002AC7FCDD|nr:A disintegrin and metalloproteinase with thrombospondin motifs 7 isoform X3 [Rhineura floridana]